MKNFTNKTIILCIALVSIFAIIQSRTVEQTNINPFKANHHNKNKSGITKFTPDNAFGGIDAQGTYKKRGKTATITYDQTVYSFNKVAEDPNPILHKNKLDLVTLGFFSDHTNSKQMPVTTYIFGAPNNDDARKAAQTIIKPEIAYQNEPEDQDASINDDISTDTIQFKPSKQFAGHDLIGVYLSSTNEATINDPSGKNKKSFAFKNVQERLPISLHANNVRPAKKPILVGFYTSIPQCSNGTPKICSNVTKRTYLYGNLA